MDNDRPIFLQIKEAIEGDILAGLLVPDDQIPSNSQLVSFFSVNPVTVHRGVSLLFEEGIVYKKRGLGMFVSPDAPALLRKRERDSFEQDFIMPLTRQAVLLDISREALHACVDRSWTGAQQEKTRLREGEGKPEKGEEAEGKGLRSLPLATHSLDKLEQKPNRRKTGRKERHD
ncbi:MAG: GntR family transcriptional regulator [Coriobacteriales bacterium]|nr:GntR family transcriptional regulator [Coriobacteriales bacterium]